MNTVEVFKTNVTTAADASSLVDSLLQLLPSSRINFDLDDCDNILRIESADTIDPVFVSDHLFRIGYFAEVLD